MQQEQIFYEIATAHSRVFRQSNTHFFYYDFFRYISDVLLYLWDFRKSSWNVDVAGQRSGTNCTRRWEESEKRKTDQLLFEKKTDQSLIGRLRSCLVISKPTRIEENWDGLIPIQVKISLRAYWNQLNWGGLSRIEEDWQRFWFT
jgi:hypothetical protein